MMIDFNEWVEVSCRRTWIMILNSPDHIHIHEQHRPEYWLDAMGLYETSYIGHAFRQPS